MTEGPQPYTNHPEYYFCDGSITFLVENELFRVHKYFFERESQYFKNYFKTSEFDGTDEDPYPVDVDVKSEDFAHLLWVWYNPHYHYEGQPRETWLAILGLASRWGFESIRELAIQQLERLPMDPVDKITLYKEHKLDKKLLVPSFVELCKSPTLPSPAEAERLQMETILRLAAARERALTRAAEQGNRSPTSALLDDEELVTIVNDVFEMGGITGEDQQEFEPAEDSQKENSNEDWFFVDQPGVNGSNGTSSSSNGQRHKSSKAEVSVNIVLYTPGFDYTLIRIARKSTRCVALICL
ncbi:hypothetical protein EDD16DRAFT_1480460 [Pisolithus croceorrhizus]|nr:hypothetical protein EDD16DRAFT_1480460 [Pisolithus croceorrhizus]KAI6163373.1 hypothetical protein EDD17DRAFT_494310 [Pisolithus thermaeus]